MVVIDNFRLLIKETFFSLFKLNITTINIVKTNNKYVIVFSCGRFLKAAEFQNLIANLQKNVNLKFTIWENPSGYTDKNQIAWNKVMCWWFSSEKEVNEWQKRNAQLKINDHREINKRLQFYTFLEHGGTGFAFWLPSGTKVINQLHSIAHLLNFKYGFHEVITPVVGDMKLYEISGHLSYYSSTMFPPISVHHEKLILRPMTCPHHCLLYKQHPRTVNHLPLRYCENSPLFRYETSGALTGLQRVRGMVLTEGHIFCTDEQLFAEINHCFLQISECLQLFGIDDVHIELSTNDYEDSKFFGDDLLWQKAIKVLKQVLNIQKINYKMMPGEAAFYGPKIDFQVYDALNHSITLATIQLDFLLPQKFNLIYFDKQSAKKQPIMIHRGLFGTYERFFAHLLEKYQGRLPFFLNPNGIVFVPISENDIHFCNQKSLLFWNKVKIYSTVINGETTLSKKIKAAYRLSPNFIIVVGKLEQNESNPIKIQDLDNKKTHSFSWKNFIVFLNNNLPPLLQKNSNC